MFFDSLKSKSLLTGILVLAGVLSVGLDSWDLNSSTEKALLETLRVAPLRVHILEHSLIYKEQTPGQVWGQDYEVLRLFAAEKGLQLKFIPHKNSTELYQSYEQQDGDIWVHRWPTFHHTAAVRGPDLRESGFTALCTKSALKKDLTSLTYLIRQDDWKTAGTYFNNEGLTTITQKAKTTWGQMAASVRLGKADCMVAENELAGWLAQRYRVLVKLNLPDNNASLNWWLNSKHKDLAAMMYAWYHRKVRANSFLSLHAHQSLYSTLSNSDLKNFNRSIDSLLPQYVDVIKGSAKSFEIPWQLIAAVSYQESHWNSTAVSFTGARGLMQLTSQTAVELGVTDREDPVQSIEAGAQYLASLFAKTSPESPILDRVALTLACYNLGWGHVLNLQKVAAEQGLDQNRWTTIKSLLPMLSSEEYKSRFNNRGARGAEANDFVERTLSFYHLLLSI